MENAFKNECLSTGELEIDEKGSVFKLSNIGSSSDKVKSSQGTKLKSSKATSVLDAFCKTSTLNESSDFIECNFKKKFIKCEVNKNEILCEICKENLTNLELHNRELHVNICIDKQISCDSEIKTPISENPFILDCPLCFKEFSSTEFRSNHIKKCGKSKGLCLQSIIKALQLQERHVLERISLGLPAKPIKPVKSNKNPVQKRVIIEPKSKAHSDIQLAQALSLSLTTSAQEQDVQVVVPVTLKAQNVHQRPGKKTKIVISSTPLLVLRTEEERKRLLLDKVATIVAPMSNCGDESPPVESNMLTKQHMGAVDKLPLLWYLSGKASEVGDYYIEELTDWIKPSGVEAGAKLCHLSQIHGHEIVTQLPCEYTFSDPGDGDRTLRDSVGPSLSSNVSSSVIECFRSLVASSWMSDVDIRTTCGTIIPAHRLLLAARCPPLKHDSNFCSGNEKKILKWETVSFDAALQFLNFLYTGNMELEKNMISDMSYLANKYQVLDLQAFLHSADNSCIPPESKLDSRISLITNEVTVSSPQPELEITYESQEEMNVNLDIVCNCINSSLKPSQPCGSQLCLLEAASPSKCCGQKSEQVEGCEISPKMESNSLESSAVHDSPSTKDSCLASPVIFDVSDSEIDSSDDDNVKVVLSHSQKSAFRQSDWDVEDLDSCGMESNNSQDSVQFLKSNTMSFNSPSKHLEKTENCILSSPSSSKLPVSSPHVNDFKIDLPSSHKFDDSHCYSSPNSFHSQAVNVSRRGISRTSNGTKVSNDEEAEDPLVETILESGAIENIRIESEMDVTRVGTGGIINNGFLFTAKIEIPDESSIPHKSKILPTPKSYKWIDYTSPMKNVSSPKILLCDSDCDSKLKKSISHEMSPSNSCQADVHPSIPSVEGLTLGDSLSDFKTAGKGFHDSQNKCCTTSVERPQTGFGICKNFKSSACIENTCSCSDIDRSPTLNELLSLCSGKQELDKTAPCVGNVDPEMLNVNDSCEPSVSSPEPFDDPYEYFEHDFVFKENSEVFPIKSPKCTRQIAVDKKAVTPLGQLADIHSTLRLSDSPVTPLPDYKTMVTPDIKQALRKIGVKALPRKKAIALLSHVYDETHPLVNGETDAVSQKISPQKDSKRKISKPKKRKISDEVISKSSKKRQNEIYPQDAFPESDDSSSENPEWLGCVPEISFSQFREDSPTKANKDDIESIKKYIHSNEDIYMDILSYKPLNMVDFHQELKNSGVKVSIQKLTDFLDEQCITFTCPRKEEVKKKQAARTQRFRKNMIAKLSQQPS